MFNFLKIIWSFFSNGFSFLGQLLEAFLNTLTIVVFPFRWLGNLTSAFGSTALEAVFGIMMFLGILITVYRILRGNI